MDDSLGVNEPLNETGQYGDGLIVRGKHYIVIDNFTESAIQHHTLSKEIMLEPQVAIAENNINFRKLKTLYHLKVSVPYMACSSL